MKTKVRIGSSERLRSSADEGFAGVMRRCSNAARHLRTKVYKEGGAAFADAVNSKALPSAVGRATTAFSAHQASGLPKV